MKTSLAVFRLFMERQDDGTVDASRVVSRDCYLAWLRHRHQTETDWEAKKFQRTVLNHVSGVDGRAPFELEEEAAVLRVIRVKQRWGCFPAHLTIGYAGFRSKGYHEKAADKAAAAAEAAASAAIIAPTVAQGRGRNSTSRHHHHHVVVLPADGSALPPLPPPLHPPLPPLHHASSAAAAASAARPTLNIADDANFETNFALAALNLTSSFPRFDVPSWVYLGNLLRFVIIARTAVCSRKEQLTKEFAAQLCDRMTGENPGSMVAIVDFLAKDYSQGLYLAQNQICLDYFGSVYELERHCAPFNVGDLFQVVTALSRAFDNPGTSFPIHAVRFNTISSGEIPMDGTYTLCPQSYALVFVGKMSSSSSSSSSSSPAPQPPTPPTPSSSSNNNTMFML